MLKTKEAATKKQKEAYMVSATEIVEIIQQIPSRDNNLKFLVSLANNAFKYGSLTERQEQAYSNVISQLTEKGLLK